MKKGAKTYCGIIENMVHEALGIFLVNFTDPFEEKFYGFATGRELAYPQ